MAKFFRNSAVSQQTFGAAGFKHIAVTTDVTGLDVVAITVLEEATLGANGIVTTTGDNLSSGTVIPAGVTIYGDFTSIHLSTGKAIAYNRALG
jgi:hypothetical protein